jgi:hypothetical protein
MDKMIEVLKLGSKNALAKKEINESSYQQIHQVPEGWQILEIF